MIFLRKSEIVALHHQLIDAYGGSHGTLNDGALESALVAAENRHYYENAGLVECAATYGWHLTQAHAFVDGNKRVGAGAMEVFLISNGFRIDASDGQLYELIMNVADSTATRQDVEAWLSSRLQPIT